MRFIGRRRILIRGLTSVVATLKTSPVRNNVIIPLLKLIPWAEPAIIYKERVSTTKYLRIFFIAI